MLPTPDTSHVPYARVYEPAEDSFLLLDTLSSPSERTFLASHFGSPTTPTTTNAIPSPTASPTPLILEIGPGSGVVLAFLTAHAQHILGRRDVLALGVDVNRFACAATGETVRRAVGEAAAEAASGSGSLGGEGGGNRDGQLSGGDGGSGNDNGTGYFLGAVQGDLTGAVRPGTVDVLVFNPPYVPTPELPSMVSLSPLQEGEADTNTTGQRGKTTTSYEEDSRLLALSYAGGRDGMETTDRVIDALPGVLSDRGVAYLLLCAQNKPEEVKGRIRAMGGGEWSAETVGTSGKQAGWEKLQIVRIWREL